MNPIDPDAPSRSPSPVEIETPASLTAAEPSPGRSPPVAMGPLVVLEGSALRGRERLHGKGPGRAELTTMLAHWARTSFSRLTASSRGGAVVGACRLLLIDDDSEHGRILAQVLSFAGHDVRFAGTGEHAVEVAARLRPHLIMVDVSRSAPRGIATARRLRRDPLTCDMPLLLLCDREDDPGTGRGFEVDALDTISLPIDVDELRARVHGALEVVAVRELLWRWANLDELVGLGNLQQLRDRLRIEESRSRRYGTALAVAMIDCDGVHGKDGVHDDAVGARSLAAIGKVLRLEVRESDLAVRYGGDRFVVLLPHAMHADALRFCQRVIRRIRKLTVAEHRITVSLGLASSDGTTVVEAGALLRAADVAARHAAHLGGDRISCVTRIDSKDLQAQDERDASDDC